MNSLLALLLFLTILIKAKHLFLVSLTIKHQWSVGSRREQFRQRPDAHQGWLELTAIMTESSGKITTISSIERKRAQSGRIARWADRYQMVWMTDYKACWNLIDAWIINLNGWEEMKAFVKKKENRGGSSWRRFLNRKWINWAIEECITCVTGAKWLSL